jgi:RNA-binding protein
MSPDERRKLRALAHSLEPVVLIGNAGLSAAVLHEIERALESHELIKIRAAGADRAERERLLAEICGSTGAEPVQHIGKVLVVHRRKPEVPAQEPSPPARKTAAPRRRASVPTRTSRR